jgi:NitT/TauT family transport system substrate-binding protein
MYGFSISGDKGDDGMGTRKYLIGGLLVVASVVVVYLMWPHGAELSEIRIGYIPFSADLPLFVALEQKYFEEENVQVKAVRFSEGSEATTALLAGQVEIIAPIAYSVQWPIIQQEPEALRMFIPEFETNETFLSAVLVRKDSDIQNIESLRGKKIGTYTGIPQLFYLKLFLKNVGMDPQKDVTIIQVGTALQVSVLEAGQFDALFTVDPFVTVAREKIGARVLVENPRSKHILNPFPMGAALVSSRFLKEHPTAVGKVYRAMAKAIDFIRADPAAAKNTLPKYTPLTADIVAKSDVYKAFKIGEDVDMTVIQRLADLMLENKLLDKKLDTRKVFLTEEEIK